MEAVTVISMRIMELLVSQSIYLILIYVAAIAFVALDLWSGVRKAKANGIASMSYGFRETLKKLAGYFNWMLIVGVLDFLLLISPAYDVLKFLPAFPYASLFGAIVVGLIELKSVREKAEDKKQFKEAGKMIADVVRHKDNPAEMVESIMNFLDTPEGQTLMVSKGYIKNEGK